MQKNQNAQKVMARKHRKVFRDTIQGLTKPAYKRLFYISYAHPKPPMGTAEFPRFGKYLLEQSRTETIIMIRNIMKAVGSLLEYEKKTVIKAETIKTALSFLGETVYLIDDDSDLVLAKNVDDVKVALKKNAPFLVFPRSAMIRFFKEVMQDEIDLKDKSSNRKDPMMSKAAALNLQLFFEAKMIELYRKSIRIARHAKRMTVIDKDVMFSRSLCTSKLLSY